jgi:hypothetical protein
MKNTIKKYLPDILILSGIWIFTYVKYFPVKGGGLTLNIDLGYNYTNHFKFLGIVLLTLGLDIIIRKLIKNNK